MRSFLVLSLLLAAADASAARRHFSWAYDTETMPERAVEQEFWVWEEYGSKVVTEGDALWATTFGLTDQLELSLPVVFAWHPDPSPTTQFESYGLDVRYRFVTSDPVDAPKIVPLLRVAARRRLALREGVDLEANAVVSADVVPRLHLVADVGIVAIIDDTADNAIGLEFGAGASYAVVGDLFLGVELTGWRTLDVPGPSVTWVAAGPAMSYTHGRFWITASYPFGFTADAPEGLPRIIWGIAF